MNLIAAVSSDWGIGFKNKLLFSIPTDMKYFREKTKGTTVIMGRKTLESFPNGKPLKNRRNIVISKTLGEIDGAEIAESTESVKKMISDDETVFIIGGESIYRQMLNMCDTAYITKVEAEAEADAFFPNLDNMSDWAEASVGDKISENGVSFRFCVYKKKAL